MSSSGGGGISIPAQPRLGSGAMGTIDAQTSSDIMDMPSSGASRFLSGPLDSSAFLNPAQGLLRMPQGPQLMVDPGSIPGMRGNFPQFRGRFPGSADLAGLLGNGKITPGFNTEGLIL